MTEEALSQPKKQRDALGRFVAGWEGGPGNLGSSRVHDLRAELLSVVDPARMRRIVTKLANLAERGNIDAARLLFDRIWGKAP